MAGGGNETMVCVAQIATAHGVRGALKLRCFTQTPENVAAYGPLCDEHGHELFALRILSRTPGGVIAQVEGITDRDAAEALRGLRLYVPRARLPEPEPDEFYHADLIGLEARDGAGRSLGRVRAVLDFGAGELLELDLAGGASELVPFTRAAVPEVDIKRGFITVVLPEKVG